MTPAQEIMAEHLPEGDFLGQVVRAAERLGWVVWHDHATNARRTCWNCGAPSRVPRNAKGLPDLLLMRGDTAFWAELKTHKGRLSPEQDAMRARLISAGQTVYLWSPRDWYDGTIERVLQGGPRAR